MTMPISYTASRDGRVSITATVNGEQVTLDLGDGMDTAEHIMRIHLEAMVNTRMGTAEHNQKRKIKAIRKAMGYSYP